MKITKQLLREIIEEEIRATILEGKWGKFAVSVNNMAEAAIIETLKSKGIQAVIQPESTKIEKQEYPDGTIYKTIYIPVRFKDTGPNP